MDKKSCDNLIDLCSQSGGRIEFNSSLKEHSTISIGGKAAVWYVPSSLEELKKVRSFLNDYGKHVMVIGSGSNILFPDGIMETVFISLSGDSFKNSRIEGNNFCVGAGQKLQFAISYLSKQGFSGLEGLVGIPATIGGALRMNASYKSAISERLLRTRVLEANGREKWIERKDINFGYRSSSFGRDDIILEAVFELSKKQSDVLSKKIKSYFSEKIVKQPLDNKSLGCIFKNPEKCEYTAGELIERSGMKGFRCGDAQVSQKHANFIVNTGKATSKDVIRLIKDIQLKVREKFSVELETEIEIL